MGAGADADEIAKAPVVEVVLGGTPSLGIGRNLILLVAVRRHQCLAGLLNVPKDVVLGQFRWLVPEHRVRLHGQLVPGQVRWPQVDGLAQVAQRIVQ
ncbi:hypothetical protein D3C79_815400 [compost metagenome]